MVNEILKLEMLENLLQRHWTDILDHVRFMRLVMQNVRDTSFKEITQEVLPPRHLRMTITKVKLRPQSDNGPYYPFELWVEFSIPKGEGVVIGSHIYLMNLTGEVILNESFGTYFRPETKSHPGS